MTDGTGEFAPTVVERVVTPHGELVLRRAGPAWEVISNGVFLMDTRDGRSERLLVSAAIERCPAPRPRVLVGGLGLGLSLVEAVRHPDASGIEVVEIEPVLVGWHHRFLHELTATALSDPRVRVTVGDVRARLEAADPAAYDAICLDTDNGPSWLVREGNTALYDEPALRLVASRLSPGGVLAVWGAGRDPAYERRLRAVFGAVAVRTVAHRRGEPDVIWLATAGAGGN